MMAGYHEVSLGAIYIETFVALVQTTSKVETMHVDGLQSSQA